MTLKEIEDLLHIRKVKEEDRATIEIHSAAHAQLSSYTRHPILSLEEMLIEVKLNVIKEVDSKLKIIRGNVECGNFVKETQENK